MWSSYRPPSEEAPPRALRVVVVDDSPEDRELYRRVLRAGLPGSQVIEADSVASGLDALREHEVDCLLLDYQLPDGDGIEMLRAIEEQRLVSPAVILLTGRGDEALAVQAMKEGARDYLVKGRLTADTLLRAVQHAVQRADLERSVAARSAELLAMNEELQKEIGERQRAEQALQEAHHHLEELVQERTRQLEIANEELRAASRLKDDFLATVSHELRTPLNAILGWAALLRNRPGDPETAERAAQVIERNSRAQAQLIADLLDMSAIVTGKLGLAVQPLDVATVAAAVEDTVRPSATAKGIELRIEVPAGLPSVLADPSRLQQVLWNLVANAVKFSPRGSLVEVTGTSDGEHVELVVRDDGIGIPPDFLPFVFDRFRQRDSSSTRLHSGLGLGLAIVRHLVEAHGGTVEAESAGEGQGATFRVRLPVLQQSSLATPGETVAADARSLAGVRVLLVEDDRDTRELCRLILEAQGATVEDASSAADAWAALERARPDVLVCDIGLPGEDGYSLVRRLRAAESAGGEKAAALPAIALTAYAGSDNVGRAQAAGFQLHLAKPVAPQELVDAVGELTRQG